MGERFGNYEIIRKLAAGGMAEVLLAKQRGLGGFERLVCLKRILPHLSAQEDFLKMFQDEARIAANLIHPNIAQIYDIAQEGDDYYIAMEYVRGEDLRRVYNQEVARGTTIPHPIAAQVMMGAAAGLDYAHRQCTLDGQPLGIVHRDISPQNIVVTYDGHVKLIDFGVAKAAGKLIETRSGVLKGKYSYMSPEQASGDPVDGRTDVFAMGITLYEVTTGTRLFKRENELETLHAVIACNVTPPSEVVPGYDTRLEAIILKALAYDPDNRFITAGDMERELERYLLESGHPTSASHLAGYMQDLFAEKLADEALFGGPPWSEPATSSKLVAARKQDAVASESEIEMEKTQVDTPLPGATQTNDDWNYEEEPLEKTASNLDIPSALADGPVENTPAPVPTEDEPEEPLAGPSPSPTFELPPIDVRQATVQIRYGRRRRRIVVLMACLTAFTAGAWVWWRQSHRASDTTASQAQADSAPVQEPPPPSDGRAYLNVAAPLPMEVTVGNRYLGDTPLRNLPMEPGTYYLKLESRSEGVVIRRVVRLDPNVPAHVNIMAQRGNLSVTGKPWAWVQIGLRPPVETPVQWDLLEGEYTLLFECPDGRRKTEQVRITAGASASAGINCVAR